MLVFACICLSRLFGLFILFLHPALTNDSVCWACRTYTHINLLNITRSLTRIISMRWLMLMMKLLPLPLPLPLVHVTSLRCVCASLSLLSLGVRCELEMAMKAQSSCCWLCVRCVCMHVYLLLLFHWNVRHTVTAICTHAPIVCFLYTNTPNEIERERLPKRTNTMITEWRKEKQNLYIGWTRKK